MAKIKKIIENGGIQYPVTITDAVKNPNNGKTVTEELFEIDSEVVGIKDALEIETKKEVVEGEILMGYINPDSGRFFIVDIGTASYYVPCNKGDVFDVFIPKTPSFGSVVGFMDKMESNRDTLEYNVNNIPNNEEYSGQVKSSHNGFLVVTYTPTEGNPTIKKIETSSEVIEVFEDILGELVKAGTDVSLNINKGNNLFSLHERRYKNESIYVSKNNIPIELDKTDYLYKSGTGVPNNQNLFAFFDKEYNLLCGSINTSGAYIKETLIRRFVPKDFWGIVKYVSINCYSPTIEDARLELIATSAYAKSNNEINSGMFSHIAGEPLDVSLKTFASGSLGVEFVEVDLSKKVYAVCSGYFNKYAADNGIKYYDGLKRLIKEVSGKDIVYIVSNDDGNNETNLGVCLNDYIGTDSDRVRYVSVKFYKGNANIEKPFINIFYADNVILEKKDITTYTGKKIITYGDSVTEGRTWQNQLAAMKGLVWNSEDCERVDNSDSLSCVSNVYHYEVASGTDANKVCFKREDGSYYYFTDEGVEVDINAESMVSVHNRITGVSGSRLIARPQDGLNYRSVHKRIQESQSFGADIVLIYGTYNDVLVGRTDSENTAYYGTKDDKPYYGLAKEGVTFSASLKGIFEILARTCPYAKVVYVSVYTFVNNPTSKEEWDSSYDACKYQNDLAKEICSQYGIPFVDLQKNFGCTWYNHMKFMAESSPHPNQYGADRTAEIIAASI